MGIARLLNKIEIRRIVGFTLLELLIVIALIGLLAGITLVSFPGVTKKAREAQGLQFSDSLRASLQMDMVGWWSFDDGSGPTAKDSWFSQNHGTLYGNPQWVKGIVNGALSFNGVTADYVRVPDSNSLDITSAITIEAWIYPQSEYVGYAAHPINKWSGTADANFVLYYFGTTSGINRQVRFYANAGGTWKSISGGYTVSLNQWYHVVLSYIPTNGGRLYINGKPIGGLTGSGVLATNNIPLRIGGPSYFNGLIDEVRIYSVALIQSQIQQHYVQGLKKHQDLVKR